jgi:hypothetical protein
MEQRCPICPPAGKAVPSRTNEVYHSIALIFGLYYYVLFTLSPPPSRFPQE